MRQTVLSGLLGIAVSLFSVLTHAQTVPGEQWDYLDEPETQGWSSTAMDEFRRFLIDETHVTGLLIIHKGRIAFEYGDVVEQSYIASIRKSVLAMLYGRYVEDGTIDLDKTVAQLGIDDVEGLRPIEKQARVRDIIAARSGVYHPEGYPGGMQEFAPERGSKQPGSYWLYSNWDFNVAGWIFERETGRNIYDEVEEQLALPLFMQDWDRALQRKSGDLSRSKYLAYPMWFSTRDMARLGLLMLYRGKWGSQQILSEAWVSEMLAQRTSHEELHSNVPVFDGTGSRYAYGYMWWLWQAVEDPRAAGAYSAKGAMGQNITVFPAIDTVLVFKTKAAYRRRNDTITRERIVQAVPKLYTGDVEE